MLERWGTGRECEVGKALLGSGPSLIVTSYGLKVKPSHHALNDTGLFP